MEEAGGWTRPRLLVWGGAPRRNRTGDPILRELFGTLRVFADAEGHRVVYLVGNHDAELWWNPASGGRSRRPGWSTALEREMAARRPGRRLPRRLRRLAHEIRIALGWPDPMPSAVPQTGSVTVGEPTWKTFGSAIVTTPTIREFSSHRLLHFRPDLILRSPGRAVMAC